MNAIIEHSTNKLEKRFKEINYSKNAIKVKSYFQF